jgi:PAS domain S-box-containing protein
MPYTDYQPKLLILDDDRAARLMLRAAAEETALFSRVVDCHSSEAALNALKEKRFDLILLDYELDDLNGIQVFERAKHLQDPIAGILVTAHDEKEVIISAIQAGIRDFLEKPIPSHILANALQRAWDELEIRILLDVESRNQIELLESLPDIVYKIDMDGYIEYINQAVEELGFQREELIGRHITQIINAEDYHAHCLQTALETPPYRTSRSAPPPQLVNERRSGSRRTQNLKIRLVHRKEKERSPYREGHLMSFGEISAKGVFEGSVVTGSLGIIRDISEREGRQNRHCCPHCGCPS